MPRVKKSVILQGAPEKMAGDGQGLPQRPAPALPLGPGRRWRRALTFAYRDRKVRKREFRALWIVRINAALRPLGLSYSKFIGGLKKAQINLDRKVLADLAIFDPQGFAKVAEASRQAVKDSFRFSVGSAGVSPAQPGLDRP